VTERLFSLSVGRSAALQAGEQLVLGAVVEAVLRTAFALPPGVGIPVAGLDAEVR